MTTTELEIKIANGEYDDHYAEYIMAHCAGDRIICNGDMLIQAMEEGYLYDDFLEQLTSAEGVTA